eukprot:m.194743 g.194743  ORF g.194743 m.194743 type:complete len:81 (+) comp32541_c2_seq2:286-528(+)
MSSLPPTYRRKLSRTFVFAFFRVRLRRAPTTLSHTRTRSPHTTSLHGLKWCLIDDATLCDFCVTSVNMVDFQTSHVCISI